MKLSVRFQIARLLLVLSSLLVEAVYADSGPHPQQVVEDNIAGVTIPCHALHLTYADRFPASKTLSPRLNPNLSDEEKVGQITSGKYKAARFRPLSQYTPGESFISYKEYHAFDFEESQSSDYIGYVRVDSQLKRERYDPDKFDGWPIISELESFSGTSERLPILVERLVRIPVSATEDRHEYQEFVYYEDCKIRWFIDTRIPAGGSASFDDYKSRYPNFPFEDTDTHIYPEGSSPTLYGYHWTVANEEDFNWELFRAQAFIVGVSALPFVGSVVPLAECLHTNESLCWASLGLDIASDAIVIGKMFKVGTIASRVVSATNRFGNVCKVERFLSRASDATAFGVAAGNITLGILYADRGKYLEGIARVSAGLGDVTAVLLANKVFKGGRIGTTANATCREASSLTVSVIAESVASRMKRLYGRAVKRKDMWTWPYERNAAGNAMDHPEVLSFGPDDVLDIPTGSDVIYAAVKADNRWGFELRVAHERVENIPSIPDDANLVKLGHPTIVRDGDDVIFGGNLKGTVGDDGLIAFTIDNYSGRISADPSKNEAGLYYLSAALDKANANPNVSGFSHHFGEVDMLGAGDNEGAELLTPAVKAQIDEMVQDIIAPSCVGG